MPNQKIAIDEKTPSEKLWLLAGELLRDEGIEDVTAHHLLVLMGQVLSCIAVYSTVDPLDPRTIKYVVERAVGEALAAHDHFLAQIDEF